MLRPRFCAPVFALCLLLAACSGGGGSGSSSAPPAPVYTIGLTFDRLTPDTRSPFAVTATLRKDGALLSGAASDITVTLGRGAHDAPAEVSTGVYRFTVTPSQTGEHPVTVSYQGTSVRRTALVLESVDPAWGQPMAVEGLVNTPGYEDGVTVSADGEYLFVQYGPLYFSAFQLFNLPRANGGCGGNRLVPSRCTHTWLDQTIGPYTGPERPGFYDGRISGTTNLHNATSWGVGVDGSPIFAPSTMFYGFHRQSDGSFAEPFYLAFADENDALINPYGLSFMLHGDGTATVLFSLNDPTDPDQVDLDGNGTPDVSSETDVFATEITLGQNNILGTFVASGTPGTPPVRSTPFPSQLVNFGKTGPDGIAGTQGNPHLYESGGVVKSVWTDDEYDGDADRGQISVYVLTSGTLTAGNWSKVVLPGVVNQPSPSNEIQPFYTGTGLFFTHSSDVAFPEIYYAAYAGTDSVIGYENATSWTTPATILGVGTADSIGKVIAVGEPTVATRSDGEYLYFVYGVIRDNSDPTGIPDINMQAGYIKKR
jgi:hypothetical protein